MVAKVRTRGAPFGALLGALALAAVAAAEPRLVQDGQGLEGLQRKTSSVAVSPDGAHVYALSDVYLLALRREADGTLEPIEEYPLLDGEGRRIVVPPDGLGVLALIHANVGQSVVRSYRRNPVDGKLTKQEDESENLGSSPFALATSHDGTLVYVSSYGNDGVVAYARDAATGALQFADRVRNQDEGVSGLVDPTWLAVSPDDRHVYTVGLEGEDETIVVLEREEDDTLSFVEALRIDDSFATQRPLDALAVTPDGEELLALHGAPAVANPHPAVLRYARSAADGRLTFVGAESLSRPGFAGVRGLVWWFALAPDGRRLFLDWISTVEPIGNAMTEWKREEDGALTPVANVPVASTQGLAGVVSPDGAWLYTVPAQGVRVFSVPEPAGAAAAALAALAALAARPRARRAPPPARASARA
ncbi:MAG TPA: hypothetical protein VIN04_07235 [Myxococcota bacterium]